MHLSRSCARTPRPGCGCINTGATSRRTRARYPFYAQESLGLRPGRGAAELREARSNVLDRKIARHARNAARDEIDAGKSNAASSRVARRPRLGAADPAAAATRVPMDWRMCSGARFVRALAGTAGRAEQSRGGLSRNCRRGNAKRLVRRLLPAICARAWRIFSGVRG